MKRIVFLILSLVIISSSAFAANFSDLAANHWAYKNVMNLVEQKVINGYPDGTYKPNGQVTRAEFFKLISIAAVGEEYFEPYKEMFKDYWAIPYVTWIYGQKLMMDGTSSTNVNLPITRLEMGVVLSNVISHLEIEEGYFEEDWSEDKITFKDIGELSEYNQLCINHVADMGLIRGYEDSTFKPNSYMSRAEVATVIYRFLMINNGRGM